jgi:hypothetical protein
MNITRKQFLEFDLVTVSVAAVRAGDNVILLNKQGGRIGCVKVSLIGIPKGEVIENQKWNFWSTKSQQWLKSREDQRIAYNSGGWGTKAETWILSLGFRKRYGLRKKQGRRYWAPEKRKTWDESFALLAQQLRNARRCAAVCKTKNAWNHWADTCGKNHRRKNQARKESQCQ